MEGYVDKGGLYGMEPMDELAPPSASPSPANYPSWGGFITATVFLPLLFFFGFAAAVLLVRYGPQTVRSKITDENDSYIAVDSPEPSVNPLIAPDGTKAPTRKGIMQAFSKRNTVIICENGKGNGIFVSFSASLTYWMPYDSSSKACLTIAGCAIMTLFSTLRTMSR